MGSCRKTFHQIREMGFWIFVPPSFKNSNKPSQWSERKWEVGHMDCTNGCRREEPSTPALKGFIWSSLVGITWVHHHHHMCLPSPFFPLKQFSNACKRKLPLLSKNIDEWPFSKTLGNVTRIFSFTFPQRTFVVVENLLMTWTNLRDLGSMILTNIFMWGPWVPVEVFVGHRPTYVHACALPKPKRQSYQSLQLQNSRD